MGGKNNLHVTAHLYFLILTNNFLHPPKKFMFDTPLAIESNGEVVTNPVYKMLQPIKKAKYPDITEVR